MSTTLSMWLGIAFLVLAIIGYAAWRRRWRQQADEEIACASD